MRVDSVADRRFTVTITKAAQSPPKAPTVAFGSNPSVKGRAYIQMPAKPTTATMMRCIGTFSGRKRSASGMVQSGRENCSAIASASNICVSVQNMAELPNQLKRPRDKCVQWRSVRNGSSGSRQKKGTRNRKPMSARKKTSSNAGSYWPMNFDKAAMMTSIMEPAETRKMPRPLGESATNQRR